MEVALSWHIGKVLTVTAFLEPGQHDTLASDGTHHECGQRSGSTQAAHKGSIEKAQPMMPAHQQPACNALSSLNRWSMTVK